MWSFAHHEDKSSQERSACLHFREEQVLVEVYKVATIVWCHTSFSRWLAASLAS